MFYIPKIGPKTDLEKEIEYIVNHNHDLISAAIKTANDFKIIATNALTTAKNGYAGIALWEAMHTIPRYWHIPAVKREARQTPADGYEIDIDLLLHTISYY